MKSKKLLADLRNLLDRKKSKRLKHLDELTALLAKLEKKRLKVQKNIPLEKDKHKLDRLRKELDVIKVQHAKGMKALRKLEEV